VKGEKHCESLLHAVRPVISLQVSICKREREQDKISRESIETIQSVT